MIPRLHSYPQVPRVVANMISLGARIAVEGHGIAKLFAAELSTWMDLATLSVALEDESMWALRFTNEAL
jgi:hypothetical protein